MKLNGEALARQALEQLAARDKEALEGEEPDEPFTLPRRPPLPAFDQLPPSYRTLANLRAQHRVIE